MIEKQENDVAFLQSQLIDLKLEQSDNNNTNLPLIKEGPWKYLPQELIDHILIYLVDPDTIGSILMTSKQCFHPSEKVYQSICQYIYSTQVINPKYNLSYWKTWKNMMIYRPRIRMNGIYSLCTKYTKAHCNDAFWEEKRFESIEMKYYRHLRFYNHGYVLYSPDVIEPYHMIRNMSQIVMKKVYLGKYVFQKNMIYVEIPLHYCMMYFQLQLHDADDDYVGKFNRLQLLDHYSRDFNIIQELEDNHFQPHPNDVHFTIPLNNQFKFYRSSKYVSSCPSSIKNFIG